MPRSADTPASETRIGGSPGPTRRTIRRALAGGVAVVALSAFGVILIRAYDKSGELPADAAPILKPDVEVYKVRPESPGGMTVPDRDKEVYETIAADPPERKVGHLMPGREEPIAPSKPKTIFDAGPAAGAPAGPAGEPPRAAPPKEADTAPAVSRYRVQLASLRSRPAAEKAWKALLGEHRDLLSRLDMSVRRVDLGAGKGVYFRLRAGPFEDRADARKLCSKLTARKVGCIVVGR